MWLAVIKGHRKFFFVYLGPKFVGGLKEPLGGIPKEGCHLIKCFEFSLYLIAANP